MQENTDAGRISDATIEAMLDSKANEIVRIDLKEKSAVTDYFVICTLNTPTHLRITRDKITEAVESAGGNLLRKEGADESGWVLMDLGDVVVHLMLRREREYYNLERTWGDAPIKRYEA